MSVRFEQIYSSDHPSIPRCGGSYWHGVVRDKAGKELLRTVPCETVREAYEQIIEGYRAMSPWFWSDDPQNHCKPSQAEEFVYVHVYEPA